jgi:zinc transport system substrate-binding protein
MKAWVLGGVAAMGLTGAAMAEAPKVVADIAPVQSLVAQVMQGVGAPSLLIPQGVSPHGYSMRPSEARALQAADVVFWVGPMLTPGLDETFETLAPEATKVELVEAEGITLLEFRDAAVFEEHIETETGSNMAENDHDEHEDHDDHKDEHEDHADHDHDDHGHEGGMDPHVWLDPENGRVMLTAIAETLAKADPENAATYRANAEAARAELADMIASVAAELAPVKYRSFIVFHDAYHYFENRFGLTGAGSLLKGDAEAPSAARLKEIEHAMEERNVVCVFSEPQFNDKIIRAIAGDAKIAEIDPIGVTQEAGAGLYAGVINGVAEAFTGCLGD